MEQLRPFETQYKKANQAERLILMKTKILPAIFTYWTAQGRCPTEAEGRIKTQVSESLIISALISPTRQQLAKWCANNWRMLQKGAVKSKNWAPKRTEVIWQTQKNAVEAEINRLREETPEKQWLGLRQTALSNILTNLSPAERLALDVEVKRIENEGNSEVEKRR